ncbi:gliding motility-associated C-terminal domain-containing protein, partial [Crocinitomicaceae bacterium]|nr:gliding motility-associated C-terminal domain-containing protein [Crocinitomicaceae bacterium]
GIFSGLAPGDYDVTTSNATCTSTSTSLTVNAIPTPPSVPTLDNKVQPTCGTPTGTITFTVQAGVEYSIGGAFQASPTFSGLAPGVYTLTVRSTTNTTCTTDAVSTETINAVPSAPSIPTLASSTDPTCGSPTGTIVFTVQAGVEYSVGGAFQASPTFTGLGSGTYTLTVRSTTDNTCTTDAASTVDINVAPGAPATPTIASTIQPTCGTPTGTIEFTAQAGVEYSIGGAFQASPIFSGLAPGSYTISVRDAINTTCVTTSGFPATINAVPSAPAAPTSTTTQPTCGTPTGTIEFTAQAGVEYSIGGAFQASPIFSGLTPGTYTLTVRSTTDNTCSTDAISTVTINAVPSAPNVPTVAGTTQPTCGIPTGSIEFTAQAGVEYSIGGAFQASPIFSGLAPGTYTLTVRSTTDNTCTTDAASTVIINAVPSVPSVPTVASTTQPTCVTATGSIEFTAQAGVEYSIGGAFQVSPIFSGLAPGSYVLSVRNTADNTCSTNGSTPEVINVQPSTPSAPVVGSITQPDCTTLTGSVIISGLPATGTWTITETIGNTTITGTGTSGTFSGLLPGSYFFTVTSASGCTSSSSASSATILSNPSTPGAPVIGTVNHPTCVLNTGTVELSGLPANGTWTITETTGNTTITGTGTSTTFSGLVSGTYTFTVTNVSGCTSLNSSPGITIDPQPSTPLVPSGDVNQSFCLEDSPIVSNLSAGGGTITWYDAASNGNAYIGSETLVDGQTYYAENSNGTCTSTTRLAVTVGISNMYFTVNSEIIPTCGKSDGSIDIDVAGGIGNYTYSWSNGITTNTLTNITDGAYTLTVTDDVNCSVDTLVRLTCESATIPEIITPNGNGKNDTWVLELDPKAEVQIFNRWGNMIYSASPYLDDWDGKANKGLSLGSDYLPSGTYFYIIDKKDGENPISGYIELVR